MTRDVAFCRAGEETHQGLRTMESRKLRRMPVVDDNKQLVGMNTSQELASLRQLLASLEDGSMSIRENGVDVTEREIGKLKIDITGLERIFARIPEVPPNA